MKFDLTKECVRIALFGALIGGVSPLICYWGPDLIDQFNKETFQSVVAEGQGESEEEALENARVEAVNIAMKSVLTEKELADVAQKTLRNDVRERPKDVFKSVKVLDSELDDETGLWKSRVEAEVLFSYLDRLGSDRLPTLAILPLGIEEDSFQDEVYQWSGDKFARVLPHSLVEKMIDSGPFPIVEREKIAELEQELA